MRPRREASAGVGREWALSSCGRNWQSRPMPSPSPSYRGYRFPSEIISHAVWLYHRFCLSFRDVEDLLAQRGVTVSYETIRHWCQTFGLDYARQLRRRRGRLGDTWYLDEVFVTCQGRRQYLWRAVDQDGDVLDIFRQVRILSIGIVRASDDSCNNTTDRRRVIVLSCYPSPRESKRLNTDC